MFKFIRKKHIREDNSGSKIVIYYSVSDIFLGAILLILVIFFIHDYLSHALVIHECTGVVVSHIL